MLLEKTILCRCFNKAFKCTAQRLLVSFGQKNFSTEPQPAIQENKKPDFDNIDIDLFRRKYPEFLPSPTVHLRNNVRELLERKDMLNRRSNIAIPEFHVGTIMAVTISDRHAPGKVNRFVGICIQRRSWGMNSQFVLRNVVDHHGVEIMYNLYMPIIQSIEVLRLEKRLDDPLFYLRDAPNEYSTFPFDMEAEYHPENAPVPINTIKVPLNPPPWIHRYERMGLQGAILPDGLSERRMKKAALRPVPEPWVKYDLMDTYRKSIPEEDQKDIYSEISKELKEYEIKQKKEKRTKVFQKPVKRNLF